MGRTLGIIHVACTDALCIIIIIIILGHRQIKFVCRLCSRDGRGEAYWFWSPNAVILHLSVVYIHAARTFFHVQDHFMRYLCAGYFWWWLLLDLHNNTSSYTTPRPSSGRVTWIFTSDSLYSAGKGALQPISISFEWMSFNMTEWKDLRCLKGDVLCHSLFIKNLKMTFSAC